MPLFFLVHGANCTGIFRKNRFVRALEFPWLVLCVMFIYFPDFCVLDTSKCWNFQDVCASCAHNHWNFHFGCLNILEFPGCSYLGRLELLKFQDVCASGT